MDATSPETYSVPTLLQPTDPALFELHNRESRSPIFLFCCHAGRAIPAALGDLGIDSAALASHIGWDPGGAEITTRLARRLDAPAVLANYSRLIVDPNRVPGAPDSIPEVSNGVVIPSNLELDERARRERLEALFWPLHRGVADLYGAISAPHQPGVFVEIHTFTPRLQGGGWRPWEAGALWNHDADLAHGLIHALRRQGDICVGDNQPYSGRDHGFSIDYHAGRHGRRHVSIEIRQDLVDTADGAAEWAEVVANALEVALAANDLI